MFCQSRGHFDGYPSTVLGEKRKLRAARGSGITATRVIDCFNKEVDGYMGHYLRIQN